MAPEIWDASIGIAITLVLVAIVMAGISVFWMVRKKSRTEPKPEAKPESKQSTPAWVWFFLLGGVAVVTYAASKKKDPQQALEPLAWDWSTLWLFLGYGVGLLTCLFVVSYIAAILRNYDRDALRALKLANAGDKDGALALLKTAMEDRKPSAIRSCALGSIHALREEWADAYKAFLDAEKIGGRQAVYIAGQGLTLRKLGRLEEAEVAYRDACAMQPNVPYYPCSLGFVLAELSRFDEARAQLAIAEEKYPKFVVFPASAKKEFAEEIMKLREKLASENGPTTS